MKITLEFEVKRNRWSVTQGEATVYCNGEKIVTFGDTIKLNKETGKWESVIPDENFVKGAIWPFANSDYNQKIKEIVMSNAE